jgi:hypothetical protein
MLSIKLFVVALPVLVACSSDPLQYSEPVGIELSAKSSDVSGSAVSQQKDITTEVGNPYGAFITAATAKLNGHAPSSIEIDQLDLSLGAQSTGVATLDEVLTGDVDVAFLVNDSNNTYDAGHITSPTGVGPDAVDTDFDWSTVSTADQARMLQGSFKVVVRGPSAATFMSKGANASLELKFTFAAFE